MARVLWDGEKIVATASKANYEHLNNLAEKYQAEFLPGVNGYAFNRSVNSILDLSTLEQTVLDPSFEDLLHKVQKRNENRDKEIEALNLPESMYPFQKEAVAQIVKWNHNVLLASDMGTGKSCMASVAINKLGTYPVLIVCPASLKVNWSMEIEKWTPGFNIYIIEGRESYKSTYVLNKVKAADVIIINYDILGVDDKEAQKREKERIKVAKENGWKYKKAFIPVSGWVDVLNEIGLKCICCDEVQAIESIRAVRTRAIYQLSSNPGIIKLFLSGTPFETRVSQFYNACHLLAPDLFPKEYDFKQRYCNPYYNGFGWTYNGVSNLDELRRKLSTFMIRHKKEEVLSQLPPKQKIPIYLDMDEKSRSEYDKMESELLAQEEGIHQFSYLAKMKEALMEIKLNAVVQFIKDMMEVEDKLCIFTYHIAMYDTLMNLFGDCAVGINGSVPNFKRQEAVNKFQKDPMVKLFVGQVQAASTGITLTASHTVIFTEWANTVASICQAEDRICRIGQNADRCLIYYLLVKDTIDEGPMETLSQHYADIQAVMNGDTNAKFVDVNESMIAKVRQRKLLKGKQSVTIEYN